MVSQSCTVQKSKDAIFMNSFAGAIHPFFSKACAGGEAFTIDY